MDSPGLACAQPLGSSSPRSHARNLGLAPASWVSHSALASAPRGTTRGTRYRALSARAPPGSMGVCCIIDVVVVVLGVVGEYLPCHVGTWAEDVSLFLSLCCTVLQLSTWVRREFHVSA